MSEITLQQEMARQLGSQTLDSDPRTRIEELLKREGEVVDDFEEEGELPRQPVTAPRSKADVLSTAGVPELIRALSNAIRRDNTEHYVRIQVQNNWPFRIAAAFISANDVAVTLFVRRGSYEPFPPAETVSLEFGSKVADVIYAGGTASLPGFDYDIVSFVIKPGGLREKNAPEPEQPNTQ